MWWKSICVFAALAGWESLAAADVSGLTVTPGRWESTSEISISVVGEAEDEAAVHQASIVGARLLRGHEARRRLALRQREGLAAEAGGDLRVGVRLHQASTA